MFEVDTPEGKKCLVQLIGPRSYRMGDLMARRGQTLTVSKRTRDYLVRKTGGAWADYDPTPIEPVEELMPPQFGEPGGPSIDMSDIDVKKNPALSQEQALALANMKGPVDMTPDSPDIADLSQKAQGQAEQPDESGDLSSKDLKAGAAQASGGASAKGGLKVTTKPAEPKAEAQAAPAPKAKAAVTVD